MSLFKQKDPQDDRRYQFLRDQHGRLWGATIELSTGDPTGPLDLLDENKRDERGNYMHKALPPVMPPLKFLIVNSKKVHGMVTIDYAGWKAEIRRGWDEYQRRMHAFAAVLYKDDAAAKVENPTPALLQAVGIEPQPVEPVLAAEAGDPWALGLTDARPAWADRFYAPRAVVTRRSQAGEDLSFMDVAPKEPASSDLPSKDYPVMYAPGRWRLSNGDTLQGKKVDALEAEAALPKAHASWDES